MYMVQIKILKENKNIINNIVSAKPKGGLVNIFNIITMMVKIIIENKENRPIFVIMLTGALVEDKRASIPYLIKKLIDDFDFPFFLIGRSKIIPVCLKPM